MPTSGLPQWNQYFGYPKIACGAEQPWDLAANGVFKHFFTFWRTPLPKKGREKKEKEERKGKRKRGGEENCLLDQRERAVRARSARDVRADEKNGIQSKSTCASSGTLEDQNKHTIELHSQHVVLDSQNSSVVRRVKTVFTSLLSNKFIYKFESSYS